MDIEILKDAKRPGEFIGVGFHAFFTVQDKHTTPEIERVLAQRWREMRPAFARVTHRWNWDVEFAARQIEMMKSAGTLVYLTTWDPGEPETPAERDAYAAKVAELFEDLVVKRKLDNIRWYCMTNELSKQGQWGVLYDDLPRFEDYHRRMWKAIKKRNLPVGLLATDASPVGKWDSILWATEHMDDMTAAYGGHHYIDQSQEKFKPADKGFYEWMRRQVEWAAAPAHAKGKPFIMGEFGPRPCTGPRYGFTRWDGCDYFDTPEEPMAALQTAEMVMASANGGADALGYWTFEDFPDEFSPDHSYANKWGTFRWDGKDFARRPVYYAMGLLTRFFRGPASVHETRTPEDVRALAIEGKDGAGYSVAVLNRREEEIEAHVRVAEGDADWEAYVFNPKDAEAYCKEGPLLNAKNRLDVREGCVKLPAASMAVLVEKRGNKRK